jgi:HAD superfamily hydrolase (TIGR01457 family)
LRCFLLDLDGTIYLGRDPIPGSPEFIRRLRETRRRFLFLTNNCSADATHYATKLRHMGIDASPDDVLTSGEAMARFLASQTPYRKVFALGTPSFETELERAGIAVGDGEAEAVILAFDKTLTYAKLERACLLLRAGLPYFATNPDKVCPTEYGYIPDCGSMAALLREATNREPKYIGKPSPEMVRMGLAKLGATPRATAMVGDRLYTDIQMAFDAGITSILVLSGETTTSDLERCARRPDFVVQSVHELSRMLRAVDE